MCAGLMTSQLGEILLMHASRGLREYTTSEQLNILQAMASISDTLNKLELYGLERLSERQYKAYLDYLDMLEEQAIKLQEASNGK
jgi:hypothetical protein